MDETKREAHRRRIGLGYGRRFRGDLHLAFKSCWEANYARVLIYRGIPFEYEKHQFELALPEQDRTQFKGRPNVRYTPDFLLTGTNHFVEVKGFLTPQSSIKMRLFSELHPELELEIVGQAEYKLLAQEYKYKIDDDDRFLGWETDPKEVERYFEMNSQRLKEEQQRLQAQQQRSQDEQQQKDQQKEIRLRNKKIYSVSVDRFILSKKGRDLLRIMNVTTIGDLRNFDEDRLYNHDGCGRASIKEVKEFIDELGFYLRK